MNNFVLLKDEYTSQGHVTICLSRLTRRCHIGNCQSCKDANIEPRVWFLKSETSNDEREST